MMSWIACRKCCSTVTRKCTAGYLVLGLIGAFATDAGLQAQLVDPPVGVDREAAAVVDRLLDQHWKRGRAQREQAEAEFGTSPTDEPAVLLAYALNRFQQGRTREGLEITGKLNDQFPGQLDAWMLNTWYRALADDYDAAMASLNSLSAALKATPKQIPLDRQRPVYQRMGKLIGYFEGPVAGAVNDDFLNATAASITRGIAPELRQAFDEGRAEVGQTLERLKQQQAQRRQDEKVKVAAENAVEAQQLKQANEQLEQTETRLAPQRDVLVAEGNQAVNELQQQADSVLGQLDSVNATAYQLEQELAFAYADWYDYQQLPPRFRGSGFLIRERINTLSFRLSQVRSDGLALSSQLVSLRNRLARTRAQFGARIDAIGDELRRATTAQRRNANRLGRLARGPEIADGKQSAMQDRRESLKTYDRLSLELYRQELRRAVK